MNSQQADEKKPISVTMTRKNTSCPCLGIRRRTLVEDMVSSFRKKNEKGSSAHHCAMEVKVVGDNEAIENEEKNSNLFRML